MVIAMLTVTDAVMASVSINYLLNVYFCFYQVKAPQARDAETFLGQTNKVMVRLTSAGAGTFYVWVSLTNQLSLAFVFYLKIYV